MSTTASFGIVGQLYHGAPESDVAAYVRDQLANHFGIDPDPYEPEAFARRLFNWYWTDPLPSSVLPPP